MDKSKIFLSKILGLDGFNAVEKAVERMPELNSLIIPRSVLSWVDSLSNSHDATVPGYEEINVKLVKSESLYSGSINKGELSYTFDSKDNLHVTSALCFFMGVDSVAISPKLKDIEITKLGKSLDLLAKSQSEEGT